jgi:hypothetical protein
VSYTFINNPQALQERSVLVVRLLEGGARELPLAVVAGFKKGMVKGPAR